MTSDGARTRGEHVSFVRRAQGQVWHELSEVESGTVGADLEPVTGAEPTQVRR